MRYLLSLVFFLSMQTSYAQEDGWSFGFGFGPNITNIDAVDDELESSIGGALWFSKRWDEKNRFDISFDYFDFDNDGASYPALSIGYGRYFFDTDMDFFAALGLGLGQANEFPFSLDDSQIAPHAFARIGVDELFNIGRLRVGLIYDFFYAFMDGDNLDSAQLGLPMLTLNWRFGDDEQKKEEPRNREDNDQDGVYDDVDQCLNSPPGAVVDINGCRKDTDGDGVLDQDDQCPDTPPNTQVNSIGCKQGRAVMKALNVRFATGSSKILRGYYSDIDKFGKFLKKNSDLNVVIEGHTDSTGSAELNTKLSKSRAIAVAAALVKRWDIDRKRISAKGFGPDKPIATNDTREGRELNRRVVAVIQ